MHTTKLIRIIRRIAVWVAAIFLLWLFVRSFLESDANTRSSIIGLIVMFISGLITHYQTKKREISARHFSDKREAYTKFIDFFFEVVQLVKTKKQMEDEELIEKSMLIKKDLIVWGGPEIVELWNSFDTKAKDGSSLEEKMRMLEDILRAIRKDLGHDDSTLPHGSLVALLLIAEDKKLLLEK